MFVFLRPFVWTQDKGLALLVFTKGPKDLWNLLQTILKR